MKCNELCDNDTCSECKELKKIPKIKEYTNSQIIIIRGIRGGITLKIFCIECGHYFETNLSDLKRNRWCNFCSGKDLCTDPECMWCHFMSFAGNKHAKDWSPNNIIKPREVHWYANINIEFICDNPECKHPFIANLSSISSGRWCKYCCIGSQYFCLNNCKICEKKSFKSCKKSKYWDYIKNSILPHQLSIRSATKCWFICENKHSFQISLDKIYEHRWCPFCINKTEALVYDFLQQTFKNIIRQYKQDWCKNIETNKHFLFDFYLYNKQTNILIEIDGRQHFEQVSNWESPIFIQERDRFKEELAIQNKHHVIRLIIGKSMSGKTVLIKDILTNCNLNQFQIFASTEDNMKEYCEKYNTSNVFIEYDSKYINNNNTTLVFDNCFCNNNWSKELIPYYNNKELTVVTALSFPFGIIDIEFDYIFLLKESVESALERIYKIIIKTYISNIDYKQFIELLKNHTLNYSTLVIFNNTLYYYKANYPN